MSGGVSAAVLPGDGRGNARFRAITRAVVADASLSDEAWREAEAIISRALASRPARMRRQLGLFLRALDVIAFVRHGRTLAALPVPATTQLLESLSRSRLLLLRRGVWGVRTLAFMGYYARADAAREIGYRASAAGWSARGEATSTSR